MKSINLNVFPCKLFSSKLERNMFISAIMLYPDGEDDKINRYVLHAALWHQKYFHSKYADSIDYFSNHMDFEESGVFLKLISAIGGWNNAWEIISNRQQKNPSKEIDVRIGNAICAAFVFKYAIINKVSRHDAVSVFCHSLQDNCGEQVEWLASLSSDKMNEENINSNIWPNFKNAVHMWAALTHFKPPKLVEHHKYIDFDALEPRGCATSDPFGLFIEIAEDYRQQGMAFRAEHSDDILLSSIKTWIVEP